MARNRTHQNGHRPEVRTAEAATVPQDPDAERAVLGAILADPSLLSVVADQAHLVPRDFRVLAHELIYRAMLELRDGGAPAELLLVIDAVEADGKTEEVGGASAISELATFAVTHAPTALADPLPYARRVKQLAAQRTSLTLAQRYAEAAHAGDWDMAASLREQMAAVVAGVQTRVSRFQLLTDEEVEQLPQPVPLVTGILIANTLAMIYGDTGTGKSFLAIDLALHIALGRAWNGHPVRQGPVVYIAAEGAAGMAKRVRAWKTHHGVSGPTGLHFIGEACQLLDPGQVAELIDTLGTLAEPPVCVIIDTLGRSMDGGDENANSDIHRMIASADAIKRATGATVLLAHHDGKDDAKGPRGGSALRHDMDTVIALKLDGDTTVAKCVKQKDLEPFRPFAFTLRRIGLDEHADLTSCVIELRSASTSLGTTLLESDRQALHCLLGQPDGVRVTEWERQSGLKHRTFYDALTRLKRDQLVICMRDRYQLTSSGVRLARTGEASEAPDVG